MRRGRRGKRKIMEEDQHVEELVSCTGRRRAEGGRGEDTEKDYA